MLLTVGYTNTPGWSSFAGSRITSGTSLALRIATVQLMKLNRGFGLVMVKVIALSAALTDTGGGRIAGDADADAGVMTTSPTTAADAATMLPRTRLNPRLRISEPPGKSVRSPDA